MEGLFCGSGAQACGMMCLVSNTDGIENNDCNSWGDMISCLQGCDEGALSVFSDFNDDDDTQEMTMEVSFCMPLLIANANCYLPRGAVQKND